MTHPDTAELQRLYEETLGHGSREEIDAMHGIPVEELRDFDRWQVGHALEHVYSDVLGVPGEVLASTEAIVISQGVFRALLGTQLATGIVLGLGLAEARRGR